MKHMEGGRDGEGEGEGGGGERERERGRVGFGKYCPLVTINVLNQLLCIHSSAY